ncbi:hypothetical protein [Legionella impletisoli]|uniref:Uncharacterized protein n=2 Tax=Legionella impletisoli TaxID=343510 RepID=A0A917JY96_9GAMM|nr:hypothetical protein [Legionella impletisoli]GGI92508.1 hypothetical protein GCM10007966_21440 [Legionella impletisoli]
MTIYICTPLAIISDDPAQYETNEFFDAASRDLTNSIEKKVFTDFKAAQTFLNKQGARWCIYEVNLPLPYPQFMAKVDLKSHEFSPKDITAIHFHPAFSLLSNAVFNQV